MPDLPRRCVAEGRSQARRGHEFGCRLRVLPRARFEVAGDAYLRRVPGPLRREEAGGRPLGHRKHRVPHQGLRELPRRLAGRREGRQSRPHRRRASPAEFRADLLPVEPPAPLEGVVREGGPREEGRVSCRFRDPNLAVRPGGGDEGVGRFAPRACGGGRFGLVEAGREASRPGVARVHRVRLLLMSSPVDREGRVAADARELPTPDRRRGLVGLVAPPSSGGNRPQGRPDRPDFAEVVAGAAAGRDGAGPARPEVDRGAQPVVLGRSGKMAEVDRVREAVLGGGRRCLREGRRGAQGGGADLGHAGPGHARPDRLRPGQGSGPARRPDLAGRPKAARFPPVPGGI